MYEVDWMPDADRSLFAILDEVDYAPSVLADLGRVQAALRSDPLGYGSHRMSSLHQIVGEGRLLVEYEIIPDDQHVLVHDCSLLPLP